MLFSSLVASMASLTDTESDPSIEFDDYEDMTVRPILQPPNVIRLKPPMSTIQQKVNILGGKKPFKKVDDIVPGPLMPYPSQEEINTFLPASKGFNFTINCWGVDAKMCTSARIGLQSAGQLIATDIRLRKPINVYVKFRNKGIFKPSISVNSTAFYTAKRVGESKELTYPQCLMKQSFVQYEVIYGGYDMMMDIQPSRFWNFDLAAKDINMLKYDFQCIIDY